MILLFETCGRIFRGQKLYRKLFREKRKADETNGKKEYLLVFPAQNRDISYTALLYLDSLFEYWEYLRELTLPAVIVSHPIRHTFFIVSPERRVVDSAEYFSKRIRGTKLLHPEAIEDFMSYYAVYKPGNVIFASFDRPNGRSCEILMNKNGVDLKTLVCMGIYGMSYAFFCGLKEPSKPFYGGENQIIRDFVNGG